jgi:predicted nucleotidyltransferase
MEGPVGISVDERRLAEICARYGVRELSLFGSAVRGEMGTDSDIDLLVVFDESSKVGLITFGRLQSELAELFGRPVDLVPRDGLKRALRSEVLSQARTLYAA